MPNLFVRKLEAYASLTPERRREIELMTSRAQLFGPHQNITYDGEESHAVHVVQSGWVCRQKVLRDGGRQITALYLPGDLCGSYVFLPDAMRQTLSTLTPVILAKASATAVRTMAASSPDFAEALWWQMLLVVEIQREWTVSVGRRSALERTAHFLCEVWTRLDLVGLAKGAECEMPMTQQDIADVLGLSSVHVNRSLHELRTRGLVEFHHKRLLIPDQRKLANLAMFDPTYLHRRAA